LIKLIKPNVLTKGGDYKINEVVGYKELKSWKGEIKIIEYIKGLSTTNIIKNAK